MIVPANPHSFFFVGKTRLTNMEGENYLSQLLANSPTSLVMTQSSQNSTLLSSVPFSSFLLLQFPLVLCWQVHPHLSHDGLRLLCRSGIGAMMLWNFYWNNARNTSRHTTQHDHDAIVSVGAGAQAIDYAVPIGVWAESQVLVRQMGEVAEHLFQDQEIAQPNGCRCAGRRCKIHMVRSNWRNF